jgi:hypothetical protein
VDSDGDIGIIGGGLRVELKGVKLHKEDAFCDIERPEVNGIRCFKDLKKVKSFSFHDYI